MTKSRGKNMEPALNQDSREISEDSSTKSSDIDTDDLEDDQNTTKTLVDMGDLILKNPFESFYEDQFETQTPTGFFSNLKSLIKKGRESLGSSTAVPESEPVVPVPPSDDLESAKAIVSEDLEMDVEQNVDEEIKDIFVFGTDDDVIKFEDAMKGQQDTDEQPISPRKRKTLREIRSARDANMTEREILKRNEDIIDALTIVNERVPWFGAASPAKPATDYYVKPSLAKVYVQ